MTSQAFFFILFIAVTAAVIAGAVWLARHDAADRDDSGRHG
ncbi:MAG TPA: hypothetical protein VK092_06835 [Deinococcales bacterium]|nr:hypothetical protein [Deinococcales bacterium]